MIPPGRPPPASYSLHTFPVSILLFFIPGPCPPPSETQRDSGRLTDLWLLLIEGQILAICLHVYSFSRQFQMHFVYRSSLNLAQRLPGENHRDYIGFSPSAASPARVPTSSYKCFIKRSTQLAETGCDVWEGKQIWCPPRATCFNWWSLLKRTL